MTLQDRKDSLIALGTYLDSNDQELDMVVAKVQRKNPWFIKEHVYQSIEAIKGAFLSESAVEKWTQNYVIPEQTKGVIALVLAGNIPAVGWHDILSVYITGHVAQIKLSKKDDVLIPFLIEKMVVINPENASYLQVVDTLKDFDKVIATGSNNTSVYFQQYFGKYPHIIRKNRSSVGIVGANESIEQIQQLGVDVFSYFGMGCRNVSFLWIHQSVSKERILKIWQEQFESLKQHTKYMNNYDYNYAVSLLNKDDFLINDIVMLKKSAQLHARIAVVHYQEYEDIQEIETYITAHQNEIQCVVSSIDLNVCSCVEPGTAQKPSLMDYPDGVDVVQFLTEKL